MKKWILLIAACSILACNIATATICQVPEKLMLRPTGLSYQNNKLYVLGRSYGTFYSIDLKNCHTTYIAGGEKNGFVEPIKFVHNSSDHQWVIADAATGMINVKNGRMQGMLGNFNPSSIAKINNHSFAVTKPSTVYKVNGDTGKTTILSDADHGSGPMMLDALSITNTQNNLFVLDYRKKQIFTINPNTGDRSIFVDLTQFKKEGVKAEQPFGIAASDQDLFVTDLEAKQIIAIDLKSRQASVLNSNDTQKDDPMIAPFEMAVDQQSHQLYVSDFGANAIYVLPIIPNHSHALRQKIVGMTIKGTYPHLIFPAQLTMSPNGDILVADERFPGVFSVNPATGKLILLSGPEKGNGPIATEAIALNQFATGEPLFTDTFFTNFYTISVNGDRRLLSPENELIPHDPWGLTKGENDDWYVSDNGESYIFKLHFDLKTHTMTSKLISSNHKGSGPKYNSLLGLVYLPGEKLVVANQKSANLLLIDAITGDRTLLSGQSRGTGPQFNYVAGLAFASPDIIYVADAMRPALFRVDVKTGNRIIVSGKDDQGHIIGKGPAFGAIPFLVLLPGQNIAYVSDVKRVTLFSVNLKTGDRRIIASGQSSH